MQQAHSIIIYTHTDMFQLGHELHTLLEQLSSLTVFSGIRVAQSLVFCRSYSLGCIQSEKVIRTMISGLLSVLISLIDSIAYHNVDFR